jgi:hypothetical protein
MQKLNIPQTANFSDLDLDELNRLRFSVYLLDYQWNYLFVNNYVKENLADRGTDLIGKNMWLHFKELAEDPSFIRLKADMERGQKVNIVTNSPINEQRLNIVGYALNDCYFFYASRLPKKDELISELRAQLEKH